MSDSLCSLPYRQQLTPHSNRFTPVGGHARYRPEVGPSRWVNRFSKIAADADPAVYVEKQASQKATTSTLTPPRAPVDTEPFTASVGKATRPTVHRGLQSLSLRAENQRRTLRMPIPCGFPPRNALPGCLSSQNVCFYQLPSYVCVRVVPHSRALPPAAPPGLRGSGLPGLSAFCWVLSWHWGGELGGCQRGEGAR